MKLMSTFAVAILSMALTLTGLDAEAARRMGGGKSVGQQSQNVTRQQAAPQPSTAPAQAAKPAAAPAPTPAAAPAPKKPWGAMLGGLAAGLGLAWLANAMGLGGVLGGAMGNILMLILMAVAAMMAWNMYKRYKASQQAQPQLQPAYANGYNPNNVGNDAAARPFENARMNYEAPQALPSQSGSMIGSGIGAATAFDNANTLAGAQSWGIPAGFDTVGFLAGAKAHFVNLQAAWDKADIATLRGMLTEEMMQEIQAQINEREATAPAGTVYRTEVVSIDAHLMGIEEIPADAHAAQYMASVEFSGQIREEIGLAPAPFREVWNLTKPVSGGGWLVAGIQALG
ncbi:MAG: Tim44-like domain-containing protein [Cytophagales bacterium]|nr:Tim44-like domain-containing protein [Cytophagales bacterium]